MLRLLVGGPRDTMCCVISIVASSGIFHVLRDVRDIEKNIAAVVVCLLIVVMPKGALKGISSPAS